MSMITVQAHFDGERIQLDEPLVLGAYARLLVALLPDRDEEREDWLRTSLRGLADAYGKDEEGYDLDCVREANPDYDGG